MRAPLLVAALLLAGCGPAASTNPDDYVGEYVFMPADTNPGDFASFVILKRDRTATEVRFVRATGQISTTQKTWYLAHGTEEDVVIGKFSHPIELTDSGIRLMINDDLGQYYEKVR